MFSTQAWAAHYGLPLNTPEDFVQGYVDAMRMDAKGQGKPCGRGFIAPGKKCSAKGSRQLAQDLKAGDLGAKARVERGKQNAMAQQAARRQQPGQGQQSQTGRKRSPEAIEQQKATRNANKAAKEARRAALQGTLDKPGRIKRTRTTTERRKEQIGRATGSSTNRARRGLSGITVANQESPKPAEQQSESKRTRSPETIEKQKATRAANKAAKQARAEATGQPLKKPGRVQRTRTTTTKRKEQIVRGGGSSTARIRRGMM